MRNTWAEPTDIGEHRRDVSTRSRTAFWIALSAVLLFLVAGACLAAVNTSLGGPDSLENLETARNIAQSNGFTTRVIVNLIVVQHIPVWQMERRPLLPHLLGALFWLFGVHLSLPVLLSVFTVATTALVLFAAARYVGGDIAGLLAVLVFLISDRYELISLMDDNQLVLATAILLYIGLRAEMRDMPRVRLALLLIALSAFGYYAKPTFLLIAVPTSIWMLARDDDHDSVLSAVNKAGIWSVVTYMAGLTLLMLPLLVSNYVHFGDVAPYHFLRLSERYDLLPYGQRRTARLGHPLTYAEILTHLGWVKLSLMDLGIGFHAIRHFIHQNLALLATIVLLLWWNRRPWPRRRWVLIGLIAAGPAFVGVFFWAPSSRYVMSIFVLLAFMFSVLVVQAGGLTLPALNKRWQRNVIRVLLVLIILRAGYHVTFNWVQAARQALHPLPHTWDSAVAATAPDARILADNPAWVAWYTDRLGIIAPAGPRDGFLKVLEVYKPDYYLFTDRFRSAPKLNSSPFGPGELQLVASGGAEPWRFYKINRKAPGLSEAYNTPGPNDH
jgi:hypothetical protein